MKKTRTLLMRLLAVAVLVAIGAVMMVIGRGHTVYLDSKSLEYNGQTYEAPYKIVVFVDDVQVAKLYDKERGMATCIGQNFEMTLEVTQEKGGDEETINVQLDLPYSMDGIAINLPAYLAGLPAEAYRSEFQPAPPPEEEAPAEEELLPGDEFGLAGDI